MLFAEPSGYSSLASWHGDGRLTGAESRGFWVFGVVAGIERGIVEASNNSATVLYDLVVCSIESSRTQ